MSDRDALPDPILTGWEAWPDDPDDPVDAVWVVACRVARRDGTPVAFTPIAEYVPAEYVPLLLAFPDLLEAAQRVADEWAAMGSITPTTLRLLAAAVAKATAPETPR